MLAWNLTWGKPEKLKFLEELKKQGLDPQALRDRPALSQWVAEYYRAFNTLSASRPIGMGGVGPIPLSEVLAYFEMFEIDELDEREAFVTMIQALDSAYLDHANKRHESKDPADGKR